jgi:hypothetical protein
VYGEAGTVGEYFVSATPLRVPAITTRVDDGLPNTWGPDGGFSVPNPAMNGWTNVTGAGWQNDYTVHRHGVSHTPNNFGVWNIRVTSSNPELFVTWVPRPTNATNATYQIFRGGTLLSTVVVNQRELPNDGILFGNTFVESLGSFSGIQPNGFLTVRLLTVGANGDVVADGLFDPPTEPDAVAAVEVIASGVARIEAPRLDETVRPTARVFGPSIAWNDTDGLWSVEGVRSEQLWESRGRRPQEPRSVWEEANPSPSSAPSAEPVEGGKTFVESRPAWTWPRLNDDQADRLSEFQWVQTSR